MTLKTATDKNRSGFFIGVGCPGCGGELAVDSDLFVIDCDHCGSAIRLTLPEVPPAFMAQAEVGLAEIRVRIDRHLKQQDHPLTDASLQVKPIYYPYWKIDAMMLKLRNRTETRVLYTDQETQVDQSFEQQKTEISLVPYKVTVPAGSPIDGLPLGIGMRAEYLKLLPYSQSNTQDDFVSLPVTQNWEVTWEAVKKRVKGIGSIATADFGTNRTELFRPIASLVYFPFYVAESYGGGDFNRYVVDGVTGRVLEHMEEPAEPASESSEPALVEFGQVDVGLHRCANCGFDLPSKQSYIYVCDNCHQLTALDTHSQVISNISMAAADTAGNDQLFPFWSFQVSPEQFPRLRKLFGGIHASDRLVIPAFRMGSFDAAYRLSKRISAAIPQFEWDSVDSFDPRFQPVSVSLAEALLTGQVLIYRAELQRALAVTAQLEEFHPVRADLLFAPFHPESYFYVDSVLNSVTFEKNTLA